MGRVDQLVVATACVVCAIVTLLCIFALPILYSQDSVHYLSLAEHLARGEGYRSGLYLFPDLMQPPLYPLLIAAGISLHASPIASAIAVCVLAEVGALLALVALHRATFGARGQLLTAALAASYPNLAIASGLTLEPLYGCLLAVAAWLLLGAQKPRTATVALGGVTLGLSLITRSETVLSAAVLGAALLAWPATRAWKARRLAAALLGAALIVVPYGLWMRAHLGNFEVLPKLRYNVPFADITDHLAWEPDQEKLTARDLRTHCTLMPDRATFVLDYAFHHRELDPRTMFPRRAAVSSRFPRLLETTRNVLIDGVRSSGLFQPLVMLLILCGLLQGLRARDDSDGSDDQRRARRVRTLALGALVATNLVPGLLSGENFQTRFVAPSLLFSLPLLAGGVGALADRVARRWPRLRPAQLVWALAIALLLVEGTRTCNILKEAGGGARVEERDLALDAALRTRVPEGARILTDHARFAYLRHGLSFALPYAVVREDLTAYIAKHQVQYALFDARLLRKNPGPENRRLLDKRNWPPDWVLLEELYSGDDPLWIIKLP